MSPTRKRMADLWFRLRKPFATIVVSLLVAMGIVGASISASADVTPPTSATPTPPTFIDECIDGQVTHAVVIPDDPYFRYIALGGIQSAGQYSVSLGQTVNVQAVSSVPVTPGATSQWSHTFTATCVVTPPDPPATPDPTVQTIYGDWTGPVPTCDNPTAQQSRTVSTITTTYTWQWNADTNQYDKISHVGDPVFGDPETRTLTYEGECTPTFKPYETSVVWKMDNPNFNTPNSYDFPQTRLSGEPEATCTPVKIQFDKYWIRDKADEDYLAGLTKLNSPADDARLEPHSYYAKIIVLPKSECETPPVLPKDASASIVLTPATCQAAGSVTWGQLVNAVAMDLDQSVGTHVALSPAVEGHLFADGTTSWQQEYTIPAKLTGKGCDDVTPPVTPPVVTPPVTSSAPPVTSVDASPLTGTDAPSTGGRGDTTSPLNGWIGGVILSIVAAGAVTGGIIKVRRRRV